MASKRQIARAIDADFEAASAAGRARRMRGDFASSATYDAKHKRLNVELTSGAAIAVPVSRIQGLASAKPAQIRAVEITGKGFGLYWPALDLDLSVPGLVAGCFGTRAWMSVLARQGGRATTAAKAAASRKNGKKGGRPRKVAATARTAITAPA